MVHVYRGALIAWGTLRSTAARSMIEKKNYRTNFIKKNYIVTSGVRSGSLDFAPYENSEAVHSETRMSVSTRVLPKYLGIHDEKKVYSPLGQCIQGPCTEDHS